MKVLFHTSSLSRSGGGVYSAAAGLAHALADQGVEVVAVGAAGEHFDEDRPAWGPVTFDPHGMGDSGYGLHRHTLTAVRRHRPDLVHVHGIWSANSICGLAAALRGVPTVVSPHGMLEPWILARRPTLKRVHAALFERPLLRRAHIHALNEAERANIDAFVTGANGRTFVLPNGISQAAPLDRPEEKHGTLFLGRLHSKKQVVELVDAWRALGLPDDETLTIAGWGDPEYEAGVRQAADGAANVTFVGPLHGEAKIVALSRARFFILPSLSEGLPMAVLEAIQHGCIPIITPECGLPELLRDGVALRMEKDFSDFGAVVRYALGFPDREIAHRSLAATTYAGNYAWPRIAREMIERYRQCIAGAPLS
jgi:poly(glycerol-phosphate) alpha-glucosyltransferase